MSQTDTEMVLLKCGKCNRNLRVALTLSGRRIRCPKCKNTLQVPQIETDTNFQEQNLPDWVNETISTRQTNPKKSDSELINTSGDTETAIDIDHLFEVQKPSDSSPRTDVLSTWSSNIKKVSRWWSGATEKDIQFYGPGTVATVDGQILDSPLIYLVSGKLQQPYDASLIETDLPVARSGRGAYELPYWPNYRQCSPEQRRNYLNWLTSGRRDPSVELGYVFIYFYGLERRIVLDKQDSVVIINELLNLLPIYKYSRSFRSYCSSLIWMATLCALESRKLSSKLLEQVLKATEYWNEANLTALLSIFHSRNITLPPEVALIVTEHDARSPRSVVLKRHPEKFRELFIARFKEHYKEGFRLKTAKNDYNFNYFPASDSLTGFNGRLSQNKTMLPNALGIPSQFKPLIRIWSEVISDLKAFDRIHRKSGSDALMSADVYEALPVELREDDHPDFENWYQIIDQYTDSEDGVAFIPISELANARGIVERSRLTKKQSQQILKTADCMDLCLEPDSRETGQNYRWDEYVSVFPKEEEGEEDLKSYHAASILLRLGMSIASADGAVDGEELGMITTHLEQQFNLSQQESVRLEHLSLLLSRHSADDTSLARKLQELPEEQRNIVGDLLVGIASADDIITPDETKALKKAFRNLKLDPDRIDRLTEGVVSVENDTSVESELILNHDRIREIMSETSKVAEFLNTVMVEDEEDEIDPIQSSEEIKEEVEQKSDSHTEVNQTDEAEVSVRFESADESDVDCEGLDARYHAFLKELLSRNHWQLSELETQARTKGLMLMGAIEAINEWSLESLGDWLIEETGDTVQVYTDLINTNKSS